MPIPHHKHRAYQAHKNFAAEQRYQSVGRSFDQYFRIVYSINLIAFILKAKVSRPEPQPKSRIRAESGNSAKNGWYSFPYPHTTWLVKIDLQIGCNSLLFFSYV
jgi:hypothetical protein